MTIANLSSWGENQEFIENKWFADIKFTLAREGFYENLYFSK